MRIKHHLLFHAFNKRNFIIYGEFYLQKDLCGYRYDTETGLYYLQSRYYNQEWGRFINADALGGSVGELLSHNVFACCKNNPISYEDNKGDFPVWALEAGEVGAETGGAIGGPIGAAIGGIGCFMAALILGNAAAQALTHDVPNIKDDNDRIIYRWADTDKNRELTIRKKQDIDDAIKKGRIPSLSFSLKPPPIGKSYFQTTINKVNATGVLRAVNDAPDHVAVFPTNPADLEPWAASKGDASNNPYYLTKVLQGICEYVPFNIKATR